MADAAGQPKELQRAPVLGPGTALVAYLFLLLGFIAVGFSTQSRDAVAGLWITEALAIALPALIALRAANASPGPYLGFVKLAGVALLVTAAAALVNQPTIALLEFGAQKLAPEAWVRGFEAKNELLEQIFLRQKWGMIATVTIAAPLGEEIFFRGFALPAMARRWGAPAAVIVSGFLFALLHLDPVGFVGLWQLGVLFGIARWATGSIWAPILAHALNNAVAAFAFLSGMQRPNEVPPTWVLALGGALFLASLPLAAKLLRRPTPTLPAERPWTYADLRMGFRPGRAGWLIALWVAAVLTGLAMLVSSLGRAA